MKKKDKRIRYENMIQSYEEAIMYDTNMNDMQRDIYRGIIEDYDKKLKDMDRKRKVN